MDPHRAVAPETPAAQPSIRRAETDPRPGGADGHPVRTPQRDPVEPAAPRDGLRVGHDLLAARLLRWQRAGVWKRLHAVLLAELRRRGQLDLARAVVDSSSLRALRGGKTGPNPTDRRKAGSKHHVLTDAHGIPLVDAMPSLRGRAGRPARKPQLIQGDRGYDSQPHRDQLRRRGIASQLAKRRTPHGSGLGGTRWVVERTLAWLHRFRRLAVRYERRPCMHEAFLSLACSLVCWYYLKPVI